MVNPAMITNMYMVKASVPCWLVNHCPMVDAAAHPPTAKARSLAPFRPLRHDQPEGSGEL